MKRIAGIGNVIVAGFFIFMTSVSVFLPSFTIAESIQDHLVHILFFLLISGILGLVINNNIILYSSFGCAAALALFLKNASNSELKNPASNKEDKFILAHVNLSVITNDSVVSTLFNDIDIDAISFQEFTPDWAAAMPLLIDSAFKYHIQDVRVDLYGKAVYSKYPVVESDSLFYDDIPNVDLKILKNNKIYRVVSSYMTPALDNLSRTKAKSQFKILERRVSNHADNIIVSGEFNQVYWSSDILSFRNKTGLLNSRRNINPSSFKMPYDHIFYSSDMECYQFLELNDLQGNHIGCKASFQIKMARSK
ncbi:MAG: endonuclease/exonuclease/phosphatase family protein [Saprospiraceae bacterium]|jgi:endonuclease/exonuclease/phosphatase (EEP) superfamily protein YafD|nr:endonuclease/exonuclease/phosphatase family protein [Saprospiraceae bacterium]MBL0023593.1 endonuclease/exonuclease/phosphatase family protein [Saprospiraceae bacterium]